MNIIKTEEEQNLFRDIILSGNYAVEVESFDGYKTVSILGPDDFMVTGYGDNITEALINIFLIPGFDGIEAKWFAEKIQQNPDNIVRL